MSTIVIGPKPNLDTYENPTRLPPVQTRGFDENMVHQQDGTYDYYAFAPPGTLSSAAVWRAFRITIAIPQVIQYAGGNSNYSNVATTLSALSYS